jgi:hypothetical protein
MRYITRCHLPEFPPYTNRLKAFPVDIRGNLCREDIYFNQKDVEQLAHMLINSEGSELWLETDVGKLKYICLAGLLAYTNGPANSPINQFIAAVHCMLDSVECYDELSELSDDSLSSYDIIDPLQIPWSDVEIAEANQYMVMAYQHKIELLMQTIETKNTELQVLERDLTIMDLRMGIELEQKNAIIRELQDRLMRVEVPSEWI